MIECIKKKLFLVFVIMSIIFLGPNVYVQAAQYQDYTYEKGEYITITGYNGNAQKLEVPSEIDGIPVREIAAYAFWECDSLVEIKIPEGVVTIGESAFGACYNLEKITIPKSVLNISGCIWGGNDKIITAGPIGSGCNLEFGWDETIPIYGFFGCGDLERVILPEGIKYISYGAFENCERLKEIELPESVQSIGALAFAKCKNLERIIIPKSVEHLGWPVFILTNNVVVYGYEDSEIELYAKQYGLKYESLGKKVDDTKEPETPGCYEYSLKAMKATIQYLDYFYNEKYPSLGTTLEWGSDEDKKIITELGLSITKNCKSEEEKIKACYEWVRDNLVYDSSAYVLPAEVLQRGSSACVGYATLLRDLLRVNGIKAVMVDGFYGDMVNNIRKSWLGRDNWDEYGIVGHAWVEVQYNGQWYLLDALWERYMYDAEEAAKGAYVEAVEGLVKAYYEGIPDAVATGIVFKDGKLYSYDYGMKQLGNHTFMLNTTYLGMATAFDNRSGIWNEDGSKVTGLDNGELISDGWYTNAPLEIEKGNITYYRPYGVTMDGAFVEHNGKRMYLGANGSPHILTGALSDYKELDGSLAIGIGESIDVLSLFPWYTDLEDSDVWFGNYTSEYLFFDKESQRITGKSPGLASIEIYVGDQETGSYNSFDCITFNVVDRVEKINLSTYELTLNEKESYHLSWELEGNYPGFEYYLSNKWVELSSSNESVAKVSCTGRIDALSAGETDIIVRSKDRAEVVAVCKLIVKGNSSDIPDDKPEIYTITYELNGGTNASGNPTTYSEETATIILQNPTRKGYKFVGWYSDSNFKTKVTQIEKGSRGNKVFYAKWKKRKYTITYELNGGKNSDKNPKAYYITTTIKKFENPTRKGYTFKGWYLDKKCTKKVTQIKKGSTGNKTLYAKWGKTKYTIKYVLNGGKNNKKNPTKYYVTTSIKKFEKPTRKGYTFKGWYSNKKCTKKITQIKKGSTGNKTLYAKWEKTKYTIKYVLNGGKNNKKNPTKYYVTTSIKKFEKPTRKGYTFKGWYLDKKCTKKVTQIKKGSTGNIKLYAKWVKKK